MRMSLRPPAVDMVLPPTKTTASATSSGIWRKPSSVTGTTDVDNRDAIHIMASSTDRPPPENRAMLSHPHGIVHTEFGGRPFSIPIMRGVWAMFVMMLVAAVLTTLGLTLYGVSFEMAIAASIAALSNAGPVLGFAPDAAGNVLGLDMMQAYAAMAPGAKLVLAIAMIAGRIEVLAAAAVLAALRTTDSA